jgi:hypothetical protein
VNEGTRRVNEGTRRVNEGTRLISARPSSAVRTGGGGACRRAAGAACGMGPVGSHTGRLGLKPHTSTCCTSSPPRSAGPGRAELDPGATTRGHLKKTSGRRPA